MKKCLCCAIILSIALSAGFVSGEDTAPARRITLVNVGAVSSAQAAEVRQYMESNLSVPVRLVEKEGSPDSDLISLARSLTAEMTWADVCFVALAAPARVGREMLFTAPDHQWAVIDVGSLNAGEGMEETTANRIRKQALRAVAHLFGLAHGTDPRGVFLPIRTAKDLDKLGGNFSPPTLEAFYTQAAIRGLNVLPRRTKRWQKRFGPDAAPKKVEVEEPETDTPEDK